LMLSPSDRRLLIVDRSWTLRCPEISRVRSPLWLDPLKLSYFTT